MGPEDGSEIGLNLLDESLMWNQKELRSHRNSTDFSWFPARIHEISHEFLWIYMDFIGFHGDFERFRMSPRLILPPLPVEGCPFTDLARQGGACGLVVLVNAVAIQDPPLAEIIPHERQ